MPITYTMEKSKKGKPYVRSVTEGQVTVEDARDLVVAYQEGGRFHQLPIIALVKDSANYAPEARKAFTEMGNTLPAMAIVLNSAALRVTLNFVIKAGAIRTGTPANIRFFKNEPEAMTWLESQMA